MERNEESRIIEDMERRKQLSTTINNYQQLSTTINNYQQLH